MTIRLSRQLSAITGWMLPPWSTGPRVAADLIPAAADAGYEGIQVFLPEHGRAAIDAGIEFVSAISPARTIDEVENVVSMWGGETSRELDLHSVTLHLGTGFESADEARSLVESTLRAANSHDVQVLVETHRATLFQDPARALALVDEFPELRFTADLSHWYTGVELVYGDLDAKLQALEPIFERCRMIHGRISDPGCIQVTVQPGDTAEHVDHFRHMWASIVTECDRSDETEVLPFVVELLPSQSHYARTIDRGEGPEEETDRWTQAGILWDIMSSAAATDPTQSLARSDR